MKALFYYISGCIKIPIHFPSPESLINEKNE